MRPLLASSVAAAAFFFTASGGIGHAQLSARARMVARGQLAPSAIGRPNAASRALVTVRLNGGAVRLQALGFPARPLTDEIAAVELDGAGLAALAQAVPDARVEERRLFARQLDRAAKMVGAPAARAATGLTGRGTLVGVIDTGIDFRHDDLRNDDGSSRVQALLDHRTPEDGRHKRIGSFGGAIWHKDEIDALLAAEDQHVTPALQIPQRDVDGHGTHVSSLAASNGRATGQGFPSGRYVGIAPEAGLLVAQTAGADGSFTDVDVLDSCRFMLTERKLLDRPLVVNLSLGGSGGPHDGTTNIEIAFDQLFPREARGLALTVAAGNDGLRDIHAGGWALDGEETLTLALDPGGSGDLPIDLWYRGDLDLAVESPGGRRTPWVPRGQHLDAMFEGEAEILIDNGEPSPNTELIDAIAVIRGSSIAPPAKGNWKLHVRGRSIRYDAWLIDSLIAQLAHFSDHIVTDDQLTVPATARSAISVGSLVSRYDWPTLDGRMFAIPASEPSRIGEPSTFSAMGPTADGRFAPDVAAPGEFIIGAMSRDATPKVPTSVFRADPSDLTLLWADDGVHGVLRGTSQATPIVTGVIALLFEADPTLSSETVREILRATAQPVPDTAAWSPKSGFGRVDAARALAYLRGARGTTLDVAGSPVGLSRDLVPPGSEETTRVTVTPRDATGLPLGPGHEVTIESSAGMPLGGVIGVGSGRYERTFVGHAPRGATGVISATVDGVALQQHPVVYFVVARDEIGSALTAGGGCAMGASQPVPLGVLVLLVFAVGAWLGRRLPRRS